MYTKSLLAALVAAPALVSAVGQAIVHNNCDYNAYLYSVGLNDISAKRTIAPGGTYTETYRKPSTGDGGISIKIFKEASYGPYASGQITQFEYTLTDMIWYDISNINGNPFTKAGLTLTPSDSSCPAKVCPSGSDFCQDAYNKPDDDHATGACSAEADTKFVLCSGDLDVSNDAVSAPVAEAKVAAPKPAPKVVTSVAAVVEPVASAPPAPVTTPAPVAPVPAPAADAGVFTTFVTQVVTVQARDAAPEPTALPLKRDESHVNMHKRAAHRHHFHRHGADAN